MGRSGAYQGLRMPASSPGLRMSGSSKQAGGIRRSSVVTRIAPRRSIRGHASSESLRRRGQSYGIPQDGRLSDAVPMPKAKGIHLRRPERAYGTGELVWHLVTAVAAVKRAFAGTKDIAIGDLSTPDGGPLRGHKSHQSGLDADIAYYTMGQRTQRHFRDATPESLDVARTWTFIETLLEQGRVQYMFIDHSLQRALYEHAREHGSARWRKPESLARVFQYPLPSWVPSGIIRHEPNHKDHIHMRVRRPEHRQRVAVR